MNWWHFPKLGPMKGTLDPRSFTIATFALCGFANFSSIGIQIGGIGALAPNNEREPGKTGNSRNAGGYHGEPDVGVYRGDFDVNSTSKSRTTKQRSSEFARADEAARFIARKTRLKPTIALVLGSGLGAFADEFAESIRIPYAKIPNFPQSTAIGHAGQLVVGKIERSGRSRDARKSASL